MRKMQEGGAPLPKTFNVATHNGLNDQIDAIGQQNANA